MLNRLIKSEADYDLSLARIGELMDAEAGTPEGDELELLAVLVELYEDEHFPMDLPDPIEAVKFRMEQLGLNQQALVPFIGNKSKVSEVLSGKRPLTLAMMRALHNGLGISAEVLLQEPGAAFPENPPEAEWSRFPIGEMIKRGWIARTEDAKNRAEELMRGFIEQAGGFKAVPEALFRKNDSTRKNAKMDNHALWAWCLRVLIEARGAKLSGSSEPGVIDEQFLRRAARLSYFDDGPRLAKELLDKHGVHLVVVPHLPKTYLDGVAMMLPDGTPVVGLTLRYDRIDNFWFCLLHELAHIGRHLKKDGNEIFIDDLDIRGHEAEVINQKEQEADEWAQNALIPRNIWEESPFRKQMKPSLSEVMTLAEQLEIHKAIVAGRIMYERRNYRLLSRHVGSGEVRKHFDYH